MRTYWLASYPKSGNTWFRVFISNLLFPEQAPVDPNRLPLNNLIASGRGPFQEILGFPSSLLTTAESARLRPAVDRIIGRDWQRRICLRKAHDAYLILDNGRPLMGEGPDFAAVYVLRNPWDVAVSAANHWARSIDEAVDILCRPKNRQDRVPEQNVSEQFPERLLGWSGHAISWLRAPLDLCLIRYEEMHARPLDTFRRAAQFLGLDCDDRAIQAAIEASAFKRLQEIETESGFREAPARENARFFRQGQTGEGLTRLNPAQIELLRAEQEKVEREIERRAMRA